MSFRIKPAHAVCAILLSICAAFYPCVRGGFSNWDDARYVENNPQVKSLSPQAVARMFTSLHGGVYKPLTTFSLAVDYKLFGLNAALYHAENVAWHAGSALLILLLATALLHNTGAALLVSLLFALHPMHAESVAWISERKDMLYAFFMLLSMLLYLRWREKPDKRLFAFSIVAFLLSLMAKPMGITLPLLLLAVDYFDGRKLDLPALKEKWPYFAMSVFFGLLTLFTVTEAQVYFLRPGYTRWDYLCSGFYGLLFYIQRLFLPVNLSAIYPFPDPGHTPLLWKLSPLAVPLLFGGICWFSRRSRETIAACALFLVSVAPALQWIPLAPSLAFDHYTYIAYLGPFLLAGKLALSVPPQKETLLTLFLTLILTYCLIGTNIRCALWADDEALWGDAIAKQPASALARLNRAEARMRKNDLPGTEQDLDDAIRLEPRYAQAYANRGALKFRQGLNANAMEDFAAALKLDTKNTVALIGRGAILTIKGRKKEALADFDAAAALDPFMTDAFTNAASIHLFEGNITAATEKLEKALSLKPSAQAYALMAQARLMQGNPASALKAATKALTLEHQNQTALSARGTALYMTGDAENAITDLQSALRQNKDDINASLYSSLAYAATGRCAEAKTALLEAKKRAAGATFPEVEKASSSCKRKQ